ncbi:MAG: tetratricopeptide repeat protein [Methylococcaceae bacterium]|nr:tetratricopeptide repeat protein [Methylococcaceae bacterium]
MKLSRLQTLGIALSLVAGIALAIGLGWPGRVKAPPPSEAATPTPPGAADNALPPAHFVGRAACAGCHAEQDRLWQGSHHDLAMQEANTKTVLGDFNNAEFSKDGVVTRFFRRDGRFMVRTDGPDGALAEFEILYTFGVTPLQQYLVPLPGGRLQALSIAWDCRPQAAGGQRWFHLYPDEKIDHRDELHWTKLSQNWNFMCAECHSTDLQKNYDQATHGYRTTWSEINVSCEACHGPGSRHIAFAEKQQGYERIDPQTLGLALRLDERQGVSWPIREASGNAVRSRPRTTTQEIETCARCHSRRGQWFADYQPGQPLMNSHLPALLRAGMYHADGQIDGEVYEYGSLLQSRMFQAGVTCSDCHEPHSLKLRAEGNGVCLQCHGADKYASEQHHFHSANSPGAQCVECHMPANNYMVVDPRRDHSFRIPRPDLTVRIGTPNACNRCHADRPARWAAAELKRRLGHDPKGYQDYAATLHAARTGAADAEDRLSALLQEKSQPAIARATAAAELRTRLTPASFPSLVQALYDAEPLVRAAALESLDPVPPQQRWEAAHSLLRDPVRVVRAMAAEALAGVPAEQIPAGEREEFLTAGEEYLAAQRFNADEPGAVVNLGNFHAALGQAAEAELAYREALAINPDWMPAYVNLGDLFRPTGRDAEGANLIQQGLARQPQAAALHHSLGLARVRQKDLPAALASLKKALDLAPEDTRFRYVYAVALHSAGKTREAQTVVKTGLKRTPGDPGLRELAAQLGQ